MAKAKKVLQVPFKDQSMMEYTDSKPGVVAQTSGWYRATSWRDNYEFKAELRLTGHYKGRSAARVTVMNCDNNETYSMGLGAFYDAVKAFGALPGVLVGTWTFRKQGANYGLVPVVPKAPPDSDSGAGADAEEG